MTPAQERPLIFISHIHEEALLACALKRELTEMFVGAVDVFIASDSESLPEGSAWLNGIRDALIRSSAALILVSNRSKDRPWINFEAGVVAFAKPMIPVCHSGLHPTQLPPTLQGWQAVSLPDLEGVRRLCSRIARIIGLREPSLNWKDVAARLGEASDALGLPEADPVGAVSAWVFPSSENPQTQTSIAASIGRCREQISLYGIGLNPLWNTDIRNNVEGAAMRGVRVRICMADFDNVDIQARLRDEPESNFTVHTAEGLIPLLVDAEVRINDTRLYEVRLFRHKPTYSMLIFDRELYVFPYPYKRLGNEAPTYLSRSRDRAMEFFFAQFERIFEDAVPASVSRRASA
jgi:hypothetical protein